MLPFDPKKPLRPGDVLLVEARVRYGYDPDPKVSGGEVPTPTGVFVTAGYSDTTIPFDQIHGIARRMFKTGEEVIFGADQRGKVLAVNGEWLWLDLGNGTPASVHQDSVTLPDDDQPDLLARG